MAQIKIGEKTYEMTTAGSASISLKDILVFKREAAVVGIEATWDDVEALGKRDFKTLNTTEVALLMTVTLWLTLRAHGEPVTLDQASDIKVDGFDFMDDAAEVEAPAPFESTPPAASEAGGVPLAVLADTGV